MDSKLFDILNQNQYLFGCTKGHSFKMKVPGFVLFFCVAVSYYNF